MFCGSGRSKSRLAKTAGAEASGEKSDQKVSKHLVSTISKWKVKSVKTPQLRGTFRKLTSQKCQNASCGNDVEV
jgi:hypothetical protein